MRSIVHSALRINKPVYVIVYTSIARQMYFNIVKLPVCSVIPRATGVARVFAERRRKHREGGNAETCERPPRMDVMTIRPLGFRPAPIDQLKSIYPSAAAVKRRRLISGRGKGGGGMLRVARKRPRRMGLKIRARNGLTRS